MHPRELVAIHEQVRQAARVLNSIPSAELRRMEQGLEVAREATRRMEELRLPLGEVAALAEQARQAQAALPPEEELAALRTQTREALAALGDVEQLRGRTAELLTGPALRELRASLELSQRRAAEVVGVTANTWARWERGEVRPIQHIAAISNLAEQVQRRVAEQTLAATASLANSVLESHSAQWRTVVTPLLDTYVRDMTASLPMLSDRYFKALVRDLTPLLERLSKLSPSAEAERKVLAYLARRGWHICNDLPLSGLRKLMAWADESADDKIDDYMVAFARSMVEDTEHACVPLAPSRAAILREAFAAHRETRFALSIPTMLAQADGIYRDLVGGGLFTTKNGVPTSAKHVEERLARADEVMALTLRSFLEPLLSGSSLAEPWWRAERFGRHGVLHGVDTTYPTEQNSLRCVLLLAYLCDVSKQLCEGGLV